MVSSSGIITMIAGNGTPGYSGDGGTGSNAQLIDPLGVGVGNAGEVCITDHGQNAVRLLTPTSQSVLVSAVVDAASESAVPVSSGKIAVIHGSGLGPNFLVQNQPVNGAFGTQTGGTTVSFNSVAAPIIY